MYYFRSYIPKFIQYNNPIKLLKNKIYGKKFLKLMPERIKILDEGTVDIDVYIVSFNNEKLIEKQIICLRKNLIDNYRLNIIDNSTDKNKSKLIEDLCGLNHVNYIKLPNNNKLQLSWSHGYSLNYIMKHFILKSKTQYFGLLDHDCFLVKKISIVDMLKNQKIRGLLHDYEALEICGYKINSLGKRWILRPGCSFFDKSVFNNGYDFTPNKKYIPLSFLDTGGGNRKYVFKYYNKNSLKLLHRKYGHDNGGKFENIDNVFFHIGGAGYKDKRYTHDGLMYLEEHYL